MPTQSSTRSKRKPATAAAERTQPTNGSKPCGSPPSPTTCSVHGRLRARVRVQKYGWKRSSIALSCDDGPAKNTGATTISSSASSSSGYTSSISSRITQRCGASSSARCASNASSSASSSSLSWPFVFRLHQSHAVQPAISSVETGAKNTSSSGHSSMQVSNSRSASAPLRPSTRGDPTMIRRFIRNSFRMQQLAQR